MGVAPAMVSDDLLTEFSEVQLQQVDAIIERYHGKRGALIPVLEEAQGVLGYLPHAVQHRIALGLNLPPSKVFGVVTFYSYFTMVPRGRHTIRVCLGTACYVRGGKKNLDRLQHELGVDAGATTPDRRFSLETIRCLGACGLAPVIVVDEDTPIQVKQHSLPELLDRYE